MTLGILTRMSPGSTRDIVESFGILLIALLAGLAIVALSPSARGSSTSGARVSCMRVPAVLPGSVRRTCLYPLHFI